MALPRWFKGINLICFLCLLLYFDLSLASLIDASSTDISNATFDYVIAGCGVAGLVLASRLTEDPNTTVLCLEAGDLDNYEDLIEYPVYIGSQPYCFYDWCLDSAPQTQLDGRIRHMPMGKGVGGGSLINGMLWNRGGQVDFDHWEQLGNPGWSWSDLLPYFQKSENFSAPWYASRDASISFQLDSFNPAVHGYEGPTSVSYPEYLWPQTHLWFEALEELGINKAVDPNDGSNAGGYFLPVNIHRTQQIRSDARRTHYNPACERTNYNLATHAQVTRIIFEDDPEHIQFLPNPSYTNSSSPIRNKIRRQSPLPLTARGVEFASSPNRPRQTVFARREVILAAGAIHTPQLLELSGIGPAPLLSSFNIPIIQDLPGVGNNLQDHAMIYLNYSYQNPSILTPTSLLSNSTFDLAAKQQYLSSRMGPWTAKPSTAVAFPSLSQIIGNASTNEMIALASLDDSFSYLPAPYHANPELLKGYATQLPLILTALLSPTTPSYEILNDNSGSLDVALMRPVSRGSTHITSPSPFTQPAIHPNWLAHPLDNAILQRAILFNQRLLSTTPLSSLQPTFNPSLPHGMPFSPSPETLSSILKERVGTEFHASCTAAMLPRDLGGVVDPELRVYGTINLRVVDASVFPVIPGAHLMAVVFAVAERAADLVRGRGVGDGGLREKGFEYVRDGAV